jgi:predicted nuclease of predicted toxin-antitoxin system
MDVSMRFLVDAQLPRRLIHRFRDAGHDALHTLDLPNGNRTTDAEIIALSMREQRVVVTKDADFVTTLLISRQPYKLPVISTGNIKNAELEVLLGGQLPVIATALTQYDFVELTRAAVVVRS